MSIATNQAQTFLRLLRGIRPRWRRDHALPGFIHALLARERAFGSRDRRLYRELIYTTLRYLPWIEPWLEREPARAVKIASWLAADNKDTRALRAELCGDWPAGASLAERAVFLDANPAALLPEWFRAHCPEIFTPRELEAQLARAPLWLRLQTDDDDAVAREFTASGWRFSRSEILRDAWRVLDDVDVTKSAAFQRGAIEVQDLGSQLLLETLGLERGGRWLDACAGAGGKTLQLARLLGSDATIDAHDVRAEALAELRTRAARAGWAVAAVDDRRGNEESRAKPATRSKANGGHRPPLPPNPRASSPAAARIAFVQTPIAGAYDGVLVDAPCSGSGTWRRAPHLKWTTTPALVAERAALQQRLLADFARAVRPGGRLVYATCSLSTHENDAVVAAFLGAHPDFRPERLARTFASAPRSPDAPGLTLFPTAHDTDGFYVSSLRRI